MESKIVSGVPSAFSFGVPGSEQVVDATYGAARVVLKATEFNNQGFNGGHYRVAASTGALTGVAAAGRDPRRSGARPAQPAG